MNNIDIKRQISNAITAGIITSIDELNEGVQENIQHAWNICEGHPITLSILKDEAIDKDGKLKFQCEDYDIDDQDPKYFKHIILDMECISNLNEE